jgi:hypothetical protein
VKENKGPFFRLRRGYERSHHTQHLSKHLRAQLHSKHGSSVKCVEMKDVLITRILVIRLPCLKRKHEDPCHPSAMC